MSFTLSKSSYSNAVQCPMILWMHKYMPQEFDSSVLNEAVFNTGNEVGDLAMGIFGDYTEVPYGDPGEMIQLTQELIQAETPVICEASFSFKGLFCSVDILKNFGHNIVELYEVKSSTSVSPIYVDDISYQVYVLRKLGYDVRRACLIHLNKNYVRFGELNLRELFTMVDLTSQVNDNAASVESTIEFLRGYMRKRREPQETIGTHCFSPYHCGFFPHCANDLPHPNVFDLKRTQLNTRMKLYESGFVSFEDLYHSGKLSDQAATQVRYELEELPDHINIPKLKEFLTTISYPLYYLDFETFQPAIPRYDASSPYDQIPFQYSLHYQKEKHGKLYHKEYLAYPYEDPRRNLAEQLCKDIPENVTVLAYNMAFEKGRIRELAALYPEYAEHLLNIHDNMKDLMIPFQQRHYYTRAMHGSYSIKYVLPALYPDDPELDYHSLEGVHNGAEASSTFLQMLSMDHDTLEEYRGYLLSYCKLDTFAMVKVLDRLYEVTEQ